MLFARFAPAALVLGCVVPVALAESVRPPVPSFAQAPATTTHPEARGVDAARSLAGAELVAELRAGGYVVYLRHTATDFSRNDSAMTSFEDCPRQRPLTEAGRAEARSIAAGLKRLGIPVGEALASPYCRTMETARLAFGHATATPEARGGPASAGSERYAGLRMLLSRKPAPGTNRAIASHGNPFYAVAGPPYLAEGEAAIVAPRGDGFTVVARIAKEGWAALPVPHGK